MSKGSNREREERTCQEGCTKYPIWRPVCVQGSFKLVNRTKTLRAAIRNRSKIQIDGVDGPGATTKRYGNHHSRTAGCMLMQCVRPIVRESGWCYARNWKNPERELATEPGTAAQRARTSDVGPPMSAEEVSKVARADAPAVIGTECPCTVRAGTRNRGSKLSYCVIGNKHTGNRQHPVRRRR